MNRKFLETCMAIALFSLVGYAVWAQSGTTTSPTPTGISTQSPMQDDIQTRLKSLRARLELIRQRVRKCGNSIVESREQCDDGNRVSGDGCSRTCTVEVIADPEPPVTTPTEMVSLNIKVFLQGPYNVAQGLMNDGLRAGSYIPLTGPSIPGEFSPVLLPSRLQVVGSSAVVDWVIVDLRALAIPSDSSNTIGSPVSTIIKSVPALLLRDGHVVGINDEPLQIPASYGNYFISVRHRNHLGVMTAESQYLSSYVVSLDFTNGTTVAYGNNPQKKLNDVYMMRAGDANGNNQVSYQGANSDADAVLATVGVSTPNAIVEGYLPTDLNLDGKTKYNGSVNDRNVVLSTVGLATPTNVVQGQIP